MADPAPPASGLTRRGFVESVAAAGLAGNAAGAAAAAAAAPTPVAASLTVNGTAHAVRVAPGAMLVDVLRDTLGLIGTKKGCGHGQCGACTVHLDGRPVLSCLLPALAVDARAVTMIEGVAAADGTLHPLQQAFIEHDALQCGFCTSGQIMSGLGCIAEGKRQEADIAEFMSGNLCRCGAYRGIRAAIRQVAEAGGARA